MIGISFLGTGNYTPTVYSYNNKTTETAYFPVVMKKIFGAEKLFVIMTKEAKIRHAEQLGKEVDFEEIMIPSGRTEEEYYSMFETIVTNIPKGEPFILDVTHGFRTQPMLALAAAVYLKYLKDCRVEGVYYGAFDPEKPASSSIFDLSPFLDLIDWTFAIRRFKEKGDAAEMAELMKNLHKQSYIKHSDYKPKELFNFGEHLHQLMNALSVIRPEEVSVEADYLKNRLTDVQYDLEQVYQTKPLAMILDEMHLTIEKFDIGRDKDIFDKDGVKMQLSMIHHYLEVGKYQQAFTMCTELLFSVACILKGVDPLNKEMRGELSRRLTAIGNGLEAVHQPLKEWEKELGDILILANEYRNDLNHAGMRKEPKPSSNMIKKAHEVKSITGDFLDKYLFVE